MSLKVLAALTRASFTELLRDRTSLSFVVLMPLLFVVFFGMAYRGMGAQTVWQGVFVSSLDFLVPGIVGLAVMWLGLFAAIPLAAERELGILRRFATLPMPRLALIVAQVSSRLVVSLGQAAMVLLAGSLLFGVHLAGNWLTVGWLVALGALTFVAMGYAVAALAPTQQAAHGWAQLLSFPMLFLCGVFFPAESLPAALWPVTQALPLTHLVEALRQVALSGEPSGAVLSHSVALVAWGAVSLTIAVRYFRWT